MSACRVDSKEGLYKPKSVTSCDVFAGFISFYTRGTLLHFMYFLYIYIYIYKIEREGHLSVQTLICKKVAKFSAF